jgi:hypothetical protein
MVGAAPEHPRAPPFEILSGAIRGADEGLTLDFPTAAAGGVEETALEIGRARAPQRRLTWEVEHRRLRHRIVIAAGLEQQDLGALEREGVSGLPSPRA